jgi:hypothetical protein
MTYPPYKPPAPTCATENSWFAPPIPVSPDILCMQAEASAIQTSLQAAVKSDGTPAFAPGAVKAFLWPGQAPFWYVYPIDPSLSPEAQSSEITPTNEPRRVFAIQYTDAIGNTFINPAQAYIEVRNWRGIGAPGKWVWEAPNSPAYYNLYWVPE